MSSGLDTEPGHPRSFSSPAAKVAGAIAGILVGYLLIALRVLIDWLQGEVLTPSRVLIVVSLAATPFFALVGCVGGWQGGKHPKPLVAALVGGLAGSLVMVAVYGGMELGSLLKGNERAFPNLNWISLGWTALLFGPPGAAGAAMGAWVARRRSRP